MTTPKLFGHTAVVPSMLALALLVCVSDKTRASTERELIQDPHFQHGFCLWKPAQFHVVTYGRLKGLETGVDPVWALSQWNSKFPLGETTIESDGSLIFSNIAKTVIVGRPGTAQGDLTLAVNAGPEYDYGCRKSASEPWVHLLVQQDFKSPRLTQLTAANLHIEARLIRSHCLQGSDYTPNLHAAQFQIYFAIGNRNSKSPGYRDYMWFGVPIYDNRSRFPVAFKQQDFGGTAKFICLVDGREFTSASAHDGTWVTINRDILPLVLDAMNTAWARGFLKGSHNLADYVIGDMNMGWELPGTFDVEMQIRNFSLKVTTAAPESKLKPSKSS